MSSKEYTHKVVKIKCCIESATIIKNPVNVKIASTNDWSKTLQSLIFKITNKKFKFLAKMDESEWDIKFKCDDHAIDKKDGNHFKEILSRTPPIAVLEIISTATKNTRKKHYTITIHHKGQTFDFKLFGNKEKWDEDTFEGLKQVIRKKFHLNSEFILYENVGDKDNDTNFLTVDIDDINDISEVFEEFNP
eukprot:291249_1